jgi:hypothetical protein
MTIQIEQTDMQSVEQLTGKNQLLVNMIPNASSWVNANLANKNNTLFFSAEDELIEQLGIGISGTSIIELKNLNLTLEIKKLMEMSIEDIQLLCADEAATQRFESAFAEIAMRYHLVTNVELSIVGQFLQNNALTVPAGWEMGLKDIIECYHSLTYVDKTLKQKSHVRADAITWGLTRAQTLAELARYYCLYLYLHKHSQGDLVQINALVEQLTAAVLDNLNCPLVTHELEPANLQHAIVQWYELGNNLGFSCLTSGLLCVARNINLTNADRISEEATIYLQQLQQRLCKDLSTDTYVNQAGACRHYIYSLPQRTMMLNVNPVGCLSLYSDIPSA